MRLRDLDARFIRYETRIESYERIIGDPKTWRMGDPVETVTGPREYTAPAETLAGAQGIRFGCPKCSGAHEVEASFEGRGVEPHQGTHNKAGQPVRWTPAGSGIDDLTLRPSVLVESGCGWHGFVTNGDAA